MAHINDISAVKFTTLSYATGTVTRSTNQDSEATAFRTAFATAANVTDVGDIREFPSLGTPANVVNVPNYGSSISSQVAGQADAPSIEFTLNYDPTNHANVDVLRRNATSVNWRVRLTDVDGLTVSPTTGLPTDNTQLYDDFYFVGQVASFEVQPSLSDAMQATFAVTISGDFAGPFSAATGASDYGPVS